MAASQASQASQVKQQSRPRLPQVGQILESPFLEQAISRLSRPIVTDAIRRVIDGYRKQRRFITSDEDMQQLQNDILSSCRSLIRTRQTRVINATGTVIHTNLGRSPISPELWDAVSEVNTGYSNLEISLAKGKRGERKGLVNHLVNALTGSEDAVVVNNNAASVWLLLNELAAGKEVIVSRGEQIQIGGGFRIPDIMRMAGAKMVEVGTSNITTADDYIDAVTEDTALVLMVHKSNFAVRGFTETADMKEVARRLPEHVLLAVDQGSGLVTETISKEEIPADRYLRQGAHLVCFSGDKIIGGPQAGIICGRKDLVKKLEKNPMMRAFRPGRVVYSLLEELLVRKLNSEDCGRGIAERSQLNLEANRQWAEREAAELGGSPEQGNYVSLVEDQLIIGGGTLPDEYYPSWSLEINLNKAANQILDELREMPVPVVAVIRNDKVRINLATILPEDRDVVAGQLRNYFFAKESQEYVK
ncbi:L-seryl-tRNA(Sec) selenium transferase [Sansalvadorimonas sp. 2012CJ34-2]|uniref:L-seryl-tRNA(Sec) selenium transferase n=1 Tax=Parendozoicomonas callyspongiae TaxID=2942213 RepID=A0ABT0PE57_9GAMM|nr:L-seryl-tRNA(Sec) selenium transferase [Sansalvadorimonas sp. 2012CJ34-2]MCL6269506.1 L-seryl-tRNA(Sec) selenium transferase [Sansalvadorimonas sp. 2012CJ34-2]